MKKQTAVEWLEEPLLNILTHQQQMQVIGLFQQAKEMEKEQIMESFEDGHTAIINSEQYYNKVYEK